MPCRDTWLTACGTVGDTEYAVVELTKVGANINVLPFQEAVRLKRLASVLGPRLTTTVVVFCVVVSWAVTTMLIVVGPFSSNPNADEGDPDVTGDAATLLQCGGEHADDT